MKLNKRCQLVEFMLYGSYLLYIKETNKTELTFDDFLEICKKEYNQSVIDERGNKENGN